MPFPSAIPDFDSRTHNVFTIARWFREHGIAWSGTPAELASELSSAILGHTDPKGTGCDELFAFLEANTQTLRELGVEVTLRKPAGRPRSVVLRATETELRTQVPAPSEEYEGFVQAPDIPAPGQLLEHEEIPTEQRFESESEESQPDPEDVVVPTPIAFAPSALDTLTQPIQHFEDSATPSHAPTIALHDDGKTTAAPNFRTIESSDGGRSRLLPWGIAGLVGLIVVAAVLTSLRRWDGVVTSSTAQTSPAAAGSSSAAEMDQAPTQNAASAPEPEPEQEPSTAVERSNPPAIANREAPGTPGTSTERDISELFRDAAEEKIPSAQYELGMTYAEGRGVKQDKVAAYAWLVLALNNGDTRSDAVLRKLTLDLSPTELQNVRVAIGNHYAEGVGVPKDYIVAHSWYSLAEVAGSAEATIRKKRLEASMTPAEIGYAKTRTTAWLNKH